MIYEKPEYTVIGETSDVVLGDLGPPGDDDVDQTSSDISLPLGLED